MAWIELVERSIGMILAASAVAKTSRPSYFLGRLGDYAFVPAALAAPLGFGVIAVEAAVSVLLLAGWADSGALLVAALLFALFAAAAWLELRQEGAGGGGGADCGCLGGVLPLRLGRATAVLNLLVCGICLASGIAAALAVAGDDVSAAMLWVLAALLAASYWVTQFAFAVVGRVSAALDEQRSPA